MSKNTWTDIRVIKDRLLRDPLFDGIPLEAIVDYTVDFIEIVGAPSLFIKKGLINKDFSEYRYELPVDFVDVEQIVVDDTAAPLNTDTFAGFESEVFGGDSGKINTNITFKLVGNYIYLPKESGKISLVYKSVKISDTDDEFDGLPMIPEDPVFMLALQSYIEVQWIRILTRANKVQQGVLDEAKQTYAWNVGRYETHSKKLNLSDMEALSKMFRTPFVKSNNFSNRFIGLGGI